MRYLVEACFNTAASRLVLSPSPGEDGVELVADGCRVELRVRTPACRDATGTAKVAVLEAQPWDSSLLRLCVNGISYGTGPLLLRDRDVLAIQARRTSEAGTPHEYTYAITRLPGPPLSSSPSPTEHDDSHGGPARIGSPPRSEEVEEEERRSRTIAANMAEYAKWNNFYSDRFGSGAVTPAAVLSGESAPSMRTCTCGYALPVGPVPFASVRCENTANASPMCGRSVLEDGQASRVVATLFPSIPTLLALSSEEEAKGNEREKGSSALLSALSLCCACPFVPRRVGGPGFPHGFLHTPGNVHESGNKQSLADSAPPSVKASPWTKYAASRRGEWKVTEPAAAKNNDVKVGGAALLEPLDRPSAELLLRLASVESALMGCRCE